MPIGLINTFILRARAFGWNIRDEWHFYNFLIKEPSFLDLFILENSVKCFFQFSVKMLFHKYSNELIITVFTKTKRNIQQEKLLNQSSPTPPPPKKKRTVFFYFSHTQRVRLGFLLSIPSNSNKAKLDTIHVYRNQTLFFLVPCHFSPPWDNFLLDFLPNEDRNGKAVRSQ